MALSKLALGSQMQKVSAAMAMACVWACSSAPQSSDNNNANKSSYAGDNANGNQSGSAGGYDGGSGDGHGGTTVAPPAKAVGPVPPAADAWCAGASQTQVVASPKLAPLFAQFCSGGKATDLLANVLVKESYAGSGTPNLHMISPISDSNGVVTAFLGVGIKAPTTAAKIAQKVSLLQGDVQSAIQLTKLGGSTPGRISSTPEAANPDKGWIRGWSMHNAASTQVAIATISIEYDTQIDQYQVGDGLLMQTTALTGSVSTMREYALLTATFDLNGAAFILTVAKIAADDHGFASIAEQTVTKTANNLATFNYQQAAAAK